MTLFEYYLQYMTRICEGSLEAPEGIILTETDEVRRAMELQQQVGAMGIPAFVRACAAAAGDDIPREAYDNFSMDDALSAVDAKTDEAIRGRLREAAGGSTMILIAHRVATLMQADQIIVLRDGRIVEQGAPEAVFGDTQQERTKQFLARYNERP